MTGLDRSQTPKTRPMPQKRTALVASLDIGTSKIACMIARLKPCPPNDALRGRTHAVELIGDSLRDFALNGKDVGKITIVMLSPKVCVVARVDQLCTHPKSIARALDTAFDHM